MKLTIERAILLKALGHVQAVVERRNTIPILSNVLINASDGFARFTATDLDMEIVEEAEASVEREGLITAPAHTLYEIARKLPEGSQVTLELGGDDPRILLSAGRSRFNLPILPPGDFPVMPSEDLAVSFTAPASEIARLIDKTKFAISTEETRYYLNGIHLHAAERDGRKTLRAVAREGTGYMYTGPWAERLVAAVQADGGKMTLEDLSNYEVLWAEPLVVDLGDQGDAILQSETQTLHGVCLLRVGKGGSDDAVDLGPFVRVLGSDIDVVVRHPFDKLSPRA